jgi:thiamine-monophosphate kinase
MVYSEKIPLSAGLKSIGIPWPSPLDLALGGGEDYELLFTVPAGKKIMAFCVGEIIKSGIFIVDKKGMKKKASIKGYQHFKI